MWLQQMDQVNSFAKFIDFKKIKIKKDLGDLKLQTALKRLMGGKNL